MTLLLASLAQTINIVEPEPGGFTARGIICLLGWVHPWVTALQSPGIIPSSESAPVAGRTGISALF